VPLRVAQEIDPRFSEEILRAADAASSVQRKRNEGGTGPVSIKEQIVSLRGWAEVARRQAAAVPRLEKLREELKGASL
jgi:argininosuccinate lyase